MTINKIESQYSILTSIIATLFFTAPIMLIGMLDNKFLIYLYSFIINFLLWNYIISNVGYNKRKLGKI